MFFDEPVRFWGAVRVVEHLKKDYMRIAAAKNIILQFVLPESPLEIHMSGAERGRLVSILNAALEEEAAAKAKRGMFGGERVRRHPRRRRRPPPLPRLQPLPPSTPGSAPRRKRPRR